jgi:hypothetical protein
MRDLFAGLDLAADHHAAEAVFEEIAFWLQAAERVLKFVCEDYFKRCLGDTVEGG